MSYSWLYRLATFFFVFAGLCVARAQMPVDNQVWHDRCVLLSSLDGKIAAGQTPAVLIAATRSLPGGQFYALAFERSQAGNHYVACTLYYLAAIADRAGNGGKPDAAAAQTAAMLGHDEVKFAQHQRLTLHERMELDKVKMSQFGHTLTLSSDQTSAVVMAGSTTPISLAPSSPVGKYAPAH